MYAEVHAGLLVECLLFVFILNRTWNVLTNFGIQMLLKACSAVLRFVPVDIQMDRQL